MQIKPNTCEKHGEVAPAVFSREHFRPTSSSVPGDAAHKLPRCHQKHSAPESKGAGAGGR